MPKVTLDAGGLGASEAQTVSSRSFFRPGLLLISVSVLKANYGDENVWTNGASNHSQSPLTALASAGPDAHVSMLVEAMKMESLRGAPGAVISLTSFNDTPVASPSLPVELTTPSYF